MRKKHRKIWARAHEICEDKREERTARRHHEYVCGLFKRGDRVYYMGMPAVVRWTEINLYRKPWRVASIVRVQWFDRDLRLQEASVCGDEMWKSLSKRTQRYVYQDGKFVLGEEKPDAEQAEGLCRRGPSPRRTESRRDDDADRRKDGVTTIARRKHA